MKKVIISIILAAASMMMASCKGEQEICKNRHQFKSAELRHGTYFLVKGAQVKAVRWENSQWRKANGYTMEGDTIKFTDGKGTHLFYNSSKN